MGRAGLPVGEALRRAVRPRGSRDVVLAGVERAEHRLLARHAGGVPQAARLRHRRRAPRAADGPRRRAGHGRPAAGSCATSSSTACAGRTTPPARRDAARLRLVPRQGRARRSSTATCGWGSPTSSRRSTRASASIASFPELKGKPIVIGESDPDGCAACQGSAARLPQHDDVFELHRRQLRPQARPRRAARRQPGRGAHLGVRVRGPAVLRRVPRRWRPTASTCRCSTCSACSAG